jgi:hypothetical protein
VQNFLKEDKANAATTLTPVMTQLKPMSQNKMAYTGSSETGNFFAAS